MEERERKERVPFQFLSRSLFFPFLSTHISSGSIPDALRHLRRAQQGVMTGVDRVGTASKASDHPYCSTTVCMIGKGKPVDEHKR